MPIPVLFPFRHEEPVLRQATRTPLPSQLEGTLYPSGEAGTCRKPDFWMLHLKFILRWMSENFST